MDLTTFDGVSMPYSMEAEQAVLGAILIDPDCMTTVVEYLKSEYFFLPNHQSIFAAMVAIDTLGGRIDPVIVLEHLKSEGVFDDAGGKQYLFQLAEIVPTSRNVEAYAKIVREKFYIRSLITATKDIMSSASNETESADTLIDAAEQRIYDIRQGKTSNGPSKISDIIINEVYDKLQKLSGDDKDLYKGYPTGYEDLDRLINGLNKSDLILIGARPAMGKTTFALNLARNVAMIGKRKVLMFSLEMTKQQLAQRILATEARVESTKMRSGDISPDEWARIGTATAVLSDCPLYFDDTSGITVQEMKSRIRREKDVEVVIIDYLGLVTSATRSENRVQEISQITRALKLMAKDLMIPVIVCAQLNRGTEGRGKSHRPQLADLRESGSIEQDADIVLMLHRPDYYGETPETEDGEEVRADQTDLIIAKNRHGPTADVHLIFNKDYTLFTSMEKIRNDM